MQLNESGHGTTSEAYVLVADTKDNERVINGMYLGIKQLYVEAKNRHEMDTQTD